MQPLSETTWCRLWLGGALLVFALTWLLAPIIDTDFFWHLKTGMWIFEHRQLPDHDPFSFLAGETLNPRQHYLLTSYWLSQLVYAIAHALGGLSGIIALRYLLVAGILACLWARRQPAPAVHAQVVTIFFVFLFANYTLDRPQTFTFLCFALQLLLVERLLDDLAGVWRYAGILLLLMLVWGNLHGGVMIGQLFLAAVLVDLGARRFRGVLSPVRFRQLFILLLLAMALPLVNPSPHGLLEFFRTFAGQALSGDQQDVFNKYISEYKSVFSILPARYSFFSVFLALFLGGYGFIRHGQLSVNVGQLLFFFFLAGIALSDLRYAPVFLIFAAPFITRTCAVWDRRLVLSLGLLFLLFIVACKEGRRDLNSLARKGMIWDYYPVAAADFIETAGIRGNVYTPVNWGSYLLWRLAPASKIFVDSRTLYPEGYLEWAQLERFESAPDHFRQDLAATRIFDTFLDKYPIDYMVLPKTRKGQLAWMVGQLMKRPNWHLAFEQDDVVIFLKSR